MTQPNSDDYSGTTLQFEYLPYAATPSFCSVSISCISVTGPSDKIPCQAIPANNILTWSFDSSDYLSGTAPGQYTLNYEVTTDEGNAALTVDFDVILNLIDPCISAEINSITQASSPSLVEYIITNTFSGPVPLSPQFAVDPSYCIVDFEFISPSELDGVVSFSEGDQSVNLTPFSDSNALSGETSTDYTTTVRYTVRSVYSPTVVEQTRDLDTTWRFKNPCKEPGFVTWNKPTQMVLADDDYSDTAYQFTYNPYTTVPSFCTITITCIDVTGPSDKITCQDFVNDKLTFQFSPQNYLDGYAPGDYVLNYEVSTSVGEPLLTEDLPVPLTLIDPCLAATINSVTVATTVTGITTATPPVELMYTITDTFTPVALEPLFAVDPSFCETTIELVEPAELQDYLSLDGSTQTLSMTTISDSNALSGPVSTTYTGQVVYRTYSRYQPSTVQT